MVNDPDTERDPAVDSEEHGHEPVRRFDQEPAEDEDVEQVEGAETRTFDEEPDD